MARATRKLEDWSKIVQALGLDLAKPLNYVTAEQIKGITGHEPRNMAYMDSEESLPDVFRRANVFLLPVENGRYAIVRGRGFHQLEPIPAPPLDFVSQAPFPLQTLGKGAQSESQHLDFAYHSRLISDFAGAPDLHPTIRGRKFTGAFDFRVNGSPIISVDGVQIEVDAGYESRENILLFECKAVATRSFLIRQLYYPLRNWAGETAKPVRAFFFLAEPQTKEYRIWEYSWPDLDDYEGITLRRSGSFHVREKPLDIRPFARVRPKDASNVIPQADDVTKLLEFPFVVASGKTDSAAVAEYFDFDVRQSSYYRQATEALGLVEMQGTEYCLTPRGRTYVGLPPDERTKLFLQIMLEMPIVHKVLTATIVAGSAGLSYGDIERIIKENSSLGGTTLHRRAVTIVAWFREVAKGVPIVRVEGRGASTRIIVGRNVDLRDFK